MLWRLHSLLASAIIVTSIPLWAVVMLISARIGAGRQILTAQIRSWMRFVSRLYGLSYDVRYPKNWEGGDRPCLVVFNHQSLFDIPAVYGAYPGDLRMLAKKELFDIPVFGAVMKKTGHVPVNQKDAESRKRSLAKLEDIARQGYHVCVMPEGSRSETRVPGLFRRGTFQMAIALGLDIRVICLVNTIEVCHRTTLWVKPRVKVGVKILEKIETRGMSVDQAEELANRVRAMIVAELELTPAERAAAGEAAPLRSAV